MKGNNKHKKEIKQEKADSKAHKKQGRMLYAITKYLKLNNN